MILEYTLFILGAYLLGSIPTAYIIVKLFKGIDIRTIGSGNVGATNAARAMGKAGFISVLFFDVLKGFIPVFIAHDFYGDDPIVLGVLVAVILGHSYTIFLKFKGGKGVATTGGAFIALLPLQLAFVLLVFVIVFYITKMVSAGSIAGSVALFVLVLVTTSWIPLQVLTGVVSFFIIWKHRSNIVRILNGTENKFEKKKK